jgi:hypothetical protein
MDNVGLSARTPIVTALLLASVAVLISADHAVQNAGSAIRHPGPRTDALSIPARESISHWLWPGAFEARGGGATAQVIFIASGRRYVAETRSDELHIRYGTNSSEALQIAFVGAARGAPAELGEEIPGALHLFTGLQQRAAVTAWRRFEVTTFHDVWPGIDARLHANHGDLELDFLVRPGADPGAIELAAQGATHFELDARSGDIFAVRADQRFRLHRPRAFQPGDTGLKEVAVRARTDGHSVRFELPAYDRTRVLVIDPLIATWSTFLGTNTDAMTDNAVALATDANGNLYVGGTTQLNTQEQASDSFPTTPGSLDPANPRSPGENCAFGCGYVLKLSPTHQVLYGALIYGFTVRAIAVDASNEALITGSTLDSTNFPGTVGVFDNDPSGQAFLSKISVDGSSFVYSGLFPADSGNGVAVDAPGNAYVVGQVSTANLPTTPGTIKPSNPQGATINQDGFLLKVSANGSTLLYGTYLGGRGTDVANAVLVDSLGEALVAGQTTSSDFVGLPGTVSGSSDAFVIKVSADASKILLGQIFGGSGDDHALALAPDGQGGWLMCGSTTSANFPTTTGVFQTHLLGQTNGWVRRLDSGLNSVYSTYFGGSAIDGCLGIAGDASANAYLVGVTFSADIPTTSGAFQEMTSAVTDDLLVNLSSPFYIVGHEADREAYLAVLSADGRTVSYGTYLGGYETSPRFYPPLTIGTGVVVTPTGTVYVSGATEAASFPVTDNGLRSGMGGQQDGFIVAFADSALAITTQSLLPAAPIKLPYSVTLNASGGTPPYTWSQVGFELPNGLTFSSGGVLSGTAANSQQEGTGYQFTVKVTDAMGAVAYKSMFVNVLYPGQFLCESNNCLTSLVAMQAISYQLPTLDRAIGQVTGTATGTVPEGISLSTSGLLAGTPLTPGFYGFVVHLNDQAGQVGTMNWQVWVSQSATPSATLTVSPQSVAIGQNYTLEWGASGSSGCMAGGGGGNGSPWSGVYPSVGAVTQTATTNGTFTYSVTCPTGTTPVQASANLTVGSSGGGGGGGGAGGGGGGGGGSGGGGGGLGWLEVVGLLALAAGRRGVSARRCRS